MAAGRLDTGGAYETDAPPAAAPTHVITGHDDRRRRRADQVVPDVHTDYHGRGQLRRVALEQAPTEDRSGTRVARAAHPRRPPRRDAHRAQALGRLSTRDTLRDGRLAHGRRPRRAHHGARDLDRPAPCDARRGAAQRPHLARAHAPGAPGRARLAALAAHRARQPGRARDDRAHSRATRRPSRSGRGFWPGVVAGWNALVDTLRGASVVIGMLLPWLVVLGIPRSSSRLVRAARRRRPPRPARRCGPGLRATSLRVRAGPALRTGHPRVRRGASRRLLGGAGRCRVTGRRQRTPRGRGDGRRRRVPGDRAGPRRGGPPGQGGRRGL